MAANRASWLLRIRPSVAVTAIGPAEGPDLNLSEPETALVTLGTEQLSFREVMVVDQQNQPYRACLLVSTPQSGGGFLLNFQTSRGDDFLCAVRPKSAVFVLRKLEVFFAELTGANVVDGEPPPPVVTAPTRLVGGEATVACGLNEFHLTPHVGHAICIAPVGTGYHGSLRCTASRMRRITSSSVGYGDLSGGRSGSGISSIR